MQRKGGETFEAHLDRTLADVRASLIFSNATYTTPVQQQVLMTIVTEIGRIVHGELMLLGLAQTGGRC